MLAHLASFAVLLARVRAGGAGAFDRAARDLRVDRSVLRRRMQTLASWVGAPILRGRGARMEPTAAGARLAERADRILALARDLPVGSSVERDRLVVACTGTITTELLPRVLVDLERRARPVSLAVRRAGGAACERLVRDGDVDLGVVRADAPPADLAAKHIADDRLWLVLPARHPLLRRRALTIEQIAKLPLVLYGPASRTRARVMARLAPLGAQIRVEVDGKSAALEYVRLGLGATFVSLLPGQRVAGGVRARDVTRLFSASRFHVIARPERWDEPLLADIIKHMVHHAHARARVA